MFAQVTVVGEMQDLSPQPLRVRSSHRRVSRGEERMAAAKGIPAAGQHVLRRRAPPQPQPGLVARGCDGRVRSAPNARGVGDAVHARVAARSLGSRIDGRRDADVSSALATCGYRVARATPPARRDRTWRVGTSFGKNVYRLPGGLMSSAPSWSLTCGAPLISRQGMAALAGLIRQPRLWMSRRCGVSAVVLHFDHLVHDWDGHHGLFGVRSPVVVADRIHRLMRGLSAVQAGLGLAPATFDDVAVPCS